MMRSLVEFTTGKRELSGFRLSAATAARLCFHAGERHLDEIDRKLLALLQEDATLSVAEISETGRAVGHAVLAAHPEAGTAACGAPSGAARFRHKSARG